MGNLEGFGENGDTLFNKTGLIYDSQDSDDLGFGVKKLSYYTYKKMVEILEGNDWDNIETIQKKTEVGIFWKFFIKNGKPIWVAWNGLASEKEITISSVNSSSCKITEGCAKIPKQAKCLAITPALSQQKRRVLKMENFVIKTKKMCAGVCGGKE